MLDFNTIKQNVESNGNVLTVTMETLRDAAGKGKLGINVRQEIINSLAGIGLGHVPVVLPANQHEQVRLYKRGTPVGDFIDVVLNAGQQNDTKLTSHFATDAIDYSVVIAQIRELVAE